jgi:hypothetical protein
MQFTREFQNLLLQKHFQKQSPFVLPIVYCTTEAERLGSRLCFHPQVGGIGKYIYSAASLGRFYSVTG